MSSEEAVSVQSGPTMDALVGRRVFHLMWDQHITQKTLGERLGIQQSGLAKKLRGTRGWSLDEVVAVSRELHVSISYLFGEEGALPPEPNGRDRREDESNLVKSDYSAVISSMAEKRARRAA